MATSETYINAKFILKRLVRPSRQLWFSFIFVAVFSMHAEAGPVSVRSCAKIFSMTPQEANLKKAKDAFDTFDREDQHESKMCQRNILGFLLRLQEQSISLEEIEILYLTPVNWSWFGATQPRSSSTIHWPYHVVARYGDHIFDFDNRERRFFPKTNEYFKSMFENQLNDIAITRIPGNLFFKLLSENSDTEFNSKMASSEIRRQYPPTQVTAYLNQRQIDSINHEIETVLYSTISRFKRAETGVAMDWIVDDQGQVTAVSLNQSHSATSDAQVVTAVSNIIRRQIFDAAPHGQTVKVQYRWNVKK